MQSLKNVPVLVTGGGGFIGSSVVHTLLKKNARVRVLDNLSTGDESRLTSIRSSIEFINGDIRDSVTCQNATKNINIVFHLAAYISVTGSMENPKEADSVNVDGIRNILLASKKSGVKKFIFSSSSAVYGNTALIPTPENTPLLPTSVYGLGKLYGEHLCRIFSDHDFNTIILRYFNVYGHGQNPNSQYAAVIPALMNAVLHKKPPVIYGDGEQTRDFIHVEDVANANIKAACVDNLKDTTFNIASGDRTSINQLWTMVATVTKSSLTPIHKPERQSDIKHSLASIEKARSILSFEPSRDITQGLRDMLRD